MSTPRDEILLTVAKAVRQERNDILALLMFCLECIPPYEADNINRIKSIIALIKLREQSEAPQ